MADLKLNKKYHPIFGYNLPQFTRHFLERYCERTYNVDKSYCISWLKANNKYKEILFKIYNAEIYDEKNAIKLRENYGADIMFLKYKRDIFVIAKKVVVVTFYKESKNG